MNEEKRIRLERIVFIAVVFILVTLFVCATHDWPNRNVGKGGPPPPPDTTITK